VAKIKRQITLARITATPFNNGTLDNVVRTLLDEARAEAKSLILVLTGASDIEQFHTQVEDADAMVAKIRNELPATFKLEVAYHLASSLLSASVFQHGGKPQAMQSDAGMVVFGENPSINADVLLALAASGCTVVVIPPICAKPQAPVISNDMFIRLLASQLATSAIEY
jgi:hypothetical protein